MELKVRNILVAEGDVDLEVAEFSLEMCLSALRKEYNKKGGAATR